MERHKTHLKYTRNMRQRKSAAHIISQVVKRNFADHEGSVFIAVGGPGGTGKSIFCKKLKLHLKDSIILSLDNYKTSRGSRAGKNLMGTHPDANKMDLIVDHLKALENGKTIEQPIYDGTTGEIKETREIKPASIIIIDGEISTYPPFREFISLSVFIDAHWKTQLSNRLDRDIEERGYSNEKAIETFLQSNLRDFSEYGADSKIWSDIHIYSTENFDHLIESVDIGLLHHFEDLFKEDLAEISMNGLVVAVPTPFTDDDKIDDKAFTDHLTYLFKKGVHRILVGGTTGEFFSLSTAEKLSLIKLAREYFPGAIIFHIGGGNLEESVLLAKQGEILGADGIIALPPYYIANAPKQGIIDHMNKISDSVHIPFMIYNFPRHTQNEITADMLRQIRHYGIKDSARDYKLVSATPYYFVGGDSVIVAAQEAGSLGFVSVQANYRPELLVDLEKALEGNDKNVTRELQNKIATISKACNGINQIGLVKHALSKIIDGYPTNVRTPLQKPTNDEIENIIFE